MPIFDIIIFLISATALSAGFLYFNSQLRETGRREPEVSHWNGKVMDATPLLPQLQKVRQAYKIEPISSPSRRSRRETLVALARTALGQLRYFREQAKDRET